MTGFSRLVKFNIYFDKFYLISFFVGSGTDKFYNCIEFMWPVLVEMVYNLRSIMNKIIVLH